MNRILASIAIILATSVLTCTCAAESPEAEKFKSIHNQVSLLNLVNGLNLTEEQQQKIIELNKRLKALGDEARGGVKATTLLVSAQSDMERLRDFLMKNPEQEDKSLQQKAQKSVEALKDYTKKEKGSFGVEMDKAAQELESIFSEQQLEVVSSFKPCIVPPKDMRNPVRAGQAGGGDITVKALEMARKAAKAGRLNVAIERISSKVVQHSQKGGKLTDAEIKSLKDGISSALREGAELDDTGFELKKAELAKRLEPVNKIAELTEELAKRTPHGSPSGHGKVKLKMFLLNPDVVLPVLEGRLKVEAPGGLKD